MKQCPQCQVEYFDEMLEFCLDDGAKLVQVSGGASAVRTKPNKPNPTTAETVNLPSQQIPATVNLNNPVASPPDTENQIQAKTQTALQTSKVLELAPVVIALAHNWWQWVYLSNQRYSTFSNYVFSANFLMWLLLLLASAAISFLALKHSQNKNFAYTSLVITAINLILFLVPER